MSTVAPAAIALAQRMKALEPSATLAMAAKAKEVKAKGKTVYDFTLGEPDFTTPAHICDAAKAAMAAGHTHYTVASGLPELKAAVAKQYTEKHGLEYKANQVIISNGAKHSLHNIFTVLVNEGDEVIIPAPYWVSYAELVKLSGGKPVILETTAESNFKLAPAALKKAINKRTKILLLCSPSNPTGTVYTPDELGALADVCIEHDLLVISDEIYDQLVYDDKPYASFPTVRPGLADRTVVVNGVSKSYAMTGWRIGWTLSPANVAAAMADLQSQETSNPCSISQYAALAAVTGPQECVAEMKKAFAKRRAWVRDRVKSLPNVFCPEMDGAFYAFIGIQSHLGKTYGDKKITGTTDWCLELLAQQNVATVMGSAFGAEGFVRISYATSDEILAKGFDGIEAFLKSAK